MLVCTAKEFLNKMSRAHVCVWVPTILTQEHTFKVIGKLVYKPVFNVCWFHGRAQIACGGSADGKITVEGKSWRMLVVNFQKPVFNLLGFCRINRYVVSYWDSMRCALCSTGTLYCSVWRITILRKTPEHYTVLSDALLCCLAYRNTILSRIIPQYATLPIGTFAVLSHTTLCYLNCRNTIGT